MKKNPILLVAEILVIGGIITAGVAPLLFHSEQPAEVGK